MTIPKKISGPKIVLGVSELVERLVLAYLRRDRELAVNCLAGSGHLDNSDFVK